MRLIEVLDNYLIVDRTSSISVAYNIDYYSVVTEIGGKVLYVRETPQEIIESSCIEAWSSYDGRRQAVTKLMNYKHKVPIPVDPDELLVAVPTRSPKHADCCWFFPTHIKNLKEIDSTSGKSTKIIFNDNESIIIEGISKYIINTQLKRGIYCLHSLREKRRKD